MLLKFANSVPGLNRTSALDFIPAARHIEYSTSLFTQKVKDDVLRCEHKLDSYIQKLEFFVSWADTVKNQVQVCGKDADSITPYGRVGNSNAARAR